MIGGIGLDVVDVARVRGLLARHGDRALARLFTDGERSYCEARAARERHYAVRVAAKEAVYKALSGTEEARAIGWREIEVRIDQAGRPTILLHALAARRATALGVVGVRISLTHGDTIAAAVAVLELSDPTSGTRGA